MSLFAVTCYLSTSGRILWSTSQEAASPALAIAQACLPPSCRELFAADYTATRELTVDHPATDMGAFSVSAIAESPRPC